MTPDIERLAKEAGGVLESWMTNPPTPAMWHFKPDQLAKLIHLAAEECAKECEATTEQGAPDEHCETKAYASAAAIRAKFPMPKEGA